MSEPKPVIILVKKPDASPLSTPPSSPLSSTSEPIMKKRITITVKKPKAAAPSTITAEQLSVAEWKNIPTIQLTRELLRIGVEVAGDKLNLVNLAREHIYKAPHLAVEEARACPSRKTLDPKVCARIVAGSIMKFALWRLGNNHAKHKCENDADLDTTKPISKIPDSYLFCLPEGDNWYGFDIRTLLLVIKNSKTPNNPFTLKPIQPKVMDQITRKTNLLEKLGFPTNREGDIMYDKLSEEDKFKLYVTDVFQKLHHLDYNVDSNYLLELNAAQLQRLYLEVADIWTYRLEELTKEQRCRIVKNGIVFAEGPSIKFTPPSDLNKPILLKKIMRNLDRIITEGVATDDRKLGATYFMIGFAIVSPKVAEIFPFLAESAEAYVH